MFTACNGHLVLTAHGSFSGVSSLIVLGKSKGTTVHGSFSGVRSLIVFGKLSVIL